MKSPKFVIPSVLAILFLAGLFALHAQQNVSIQSPNPNQVEAGGPISIHITFDKPLPEGAYARVEISPENVTQWIPLSTGDPDDASRTAFTAKGVLPANSVPGKWVFRNVWLFLPGSVQGQSLGHNNATFQVKGKEFPIPSKAEITVTK